MSSFKSTTKCLAVMEANGSFQPHEVEIRAPDAKDVVIDVQYAGICHSDIHQVKEEWGPAMFPMVPGHEIAGVRQMDIRRFEESKKRSF